ncbi:hypothetical protein Marpi_0770 [Marinitoga piezophila KA3]|uniref:Uncharacterized protein n=1 Tax=Marinitoga piezophila (strain DSM 14283 / JCM 11233 / KA3) TaxID=443254 RepID=H2J6L5_MARPK|nr:hypothetical protein [Marinitoga piezophila]AEX85200.1 hypothetical protein Marpi_0770 [Marinitoga piezophila KA3]
MKKIIIGLLFTLLSINLFANILIHESSFFPENGFNVINNDNFHIEIIKLYEDNNSKAFLIRADKIYFDPDYKFVFKLKIITENETYEKNLYPDRTDKKSLKLSPQLIIMPSKAKIYLNDIPLEKYYAFPDAKSLSEILKDIKIHTFYFYKKVSEDKYIPVKNFEKNEEVYLLFAGNPKFTNKAIININNGKMNILTYPEFKILSGKSYVFQKIGKLTESKYIITLKYDKRSYSYEITIK